MIVPRPGTDAALAMAVAFVRMTEGIHNKDDAAGKTLGFDEFKKYVLGETDEFPRLLSGRRKESGVDARVIRTLAREWAGNSPFCWGVARAAVRAAPAGRPTPPNGRA